MSSRGVEDDETITLLLDCFTSLAMTLEDMSSRGVEDDETITLLLDCFASFAMTLEELAGSAHWPSEQVRL